LVVQSNYADGKPWTVEAAGRKFELPPYGWVIEKPGEILAYSALHDGHRVDVVQCPEYVYVNSGKHKFKDATVPAEIQGAIWLKRQGDGWQAIPCGDLGLWEKFHPQEWPDDLYDMRVGKTPDDRGLQECLIDTKQLLGKPASQVSVTARGADGQVVEAQGISVDGERLRIAPQRDIVGYVLK